MLSGVRRFGASKYESFYNVFLYIIILMIIINFCDLSEQIVNIKMKQTKTYFVVWHRSIQMLHKSNIGKTYRFLHIFFKIHKACKILCLILYSNKFNFYRYYGESEAKLKSFFAEAKERWVFWKMICGKDSELDSRVILEECESDVAFR